MGDEDNHDENIELDKLNYLLSTTATNLNDPGDPYIDQLSKILTNLYLCGEYVLSYFLRIV